MPINVRPPFFSAGTIAILLVALIALVVVCIFLGSLGMDIHLNR